MNVEISMYESLQWVDGCLKLCSLLTKSLMMMSVPPYRRLTYWRAAFYIVILQKTPETFAFPVVKVCRWVIFPSKRLFYWSYESFPYTSQKRSIGRVLSFWWLAKNCCVTWASKYLLSFLSAALKFLPMSETTLAGLPLCAKIRLKVLMKALADFSWHISRCRARVVRQVIIAP